MLYRSFLLFLQREKPVKMLFDDVLRRVGEFGPYQIGLYCLLGFVGFPAGTLFSSIKIITLLAVFHLFFQSSFSQTHKFGNVGIIANFVLPYVCSFLLYLRQQVLINGKLEIKGYMKIIFQG